MRASSRTRPQIAYPPLRGFFSRFAGALHGALTMRRKVEIGQTSPWAKMLLVPFAGAIVASSANCRTLAQVLFWLAFAMFVTGDRKLAEND